MGGVEVETALLVTGYYVEISFAFKYFGAAIRSDRLERVKGIEPSS
jgi:hypothetical protein